MGTALGAPYHEATPRDASSGLLESLFVTGYNKTKPLRCIQLAAAVSPLNYSDFFILAVRKKKPHHCLTGKKRNKKNKQTEVTFRTEPLGAPAGAWAVEVFFAFHGL